MAAVSLEKQVSSTREHLNLKKKPVSLILQ